MFTKSSKLITGVSVALVAIAAGLLLWSMGGGSASADTTVVKLHGNTAYGSFWGSGGYGSVWVSENGTGNDKTTFISYYTYGPSGYNSGYGQIPNGDFSANPEGARLDTDTSRITGGYVYGSTGALTGTWDDNGFWSQSWSGTQSSSYSGYEYQHSGTQNWRSADANITLLGNTGSNTWGQIGFQRINLRIQTP